MEKLLPSLRLPITTIDQPKTNGHNETRIRNPWKYAYDQIDRPEQN